MNSEILNSFVLLLTCPDQKGLVYKISNFVYQLGANITDLDEHVETDIDFFSIRVAFNFEDDSITKQMIIDKFSDLANEFNAEFEIHRKSRKNRVALFISKYDHCVREILWRYSLNEYEMDIPLIISNHSELQFLAEQYSIPFYHFPIDKENKAVQEEKEIELLKQHQIDTIVLARYMQILSPDFVNSFPNKIINIHHSFLPAFIGGNPYKQAYDRGVKIIGATSHFVTSDLDEGPIIEQDIVRISHKDSIKDLKRKGRDLERLVLAKALQLYTEHRIIVRGKRTVVFE